MASLFELELQLKKKDGCNVYLFTYPEKVGNSISWIKEMKMQGYTIYFMPLGDLDKDHFVKKIVKDHDIGTVHTHFLTGKQFMILKMSLSGLNIDVVVHYHNHASQSNNLIKKIVRWMLYRKCKLIGVSQSVTEGLKEIFPYSSVYEVDNAIDFSRLNQFEEVELKKKMDASKTKICLLFGFDYERKGVDLAIASIQKLIEYGENIVLWISLSTNENMVKDKIIGRFGEIPQWVTFLKARNDVATYYRAADVFLSPSREEGFCYSIVEAAYCDCKIVASRIPAQKDLQVPGVYWFEPENIVQMRDCIYKAIHDENRYNNTTIIMNIYDLHEWARKVIEVYEKL